MTKRPSWRIAIVIYVIYNLIIYSAWAAVGADYANMTGAGVILQSLFLPLVLGFVFLAGTLSWLGWWKPVMRDTDQAQPAWAQWPIILIAIGFVTVGLVGTDWSRIAGSHLLLLVGAGILVGFNEEALTRGILVVGFREGGHGEAWVWFMSSALFGLLHLPNALFGLPVAGAVVQVIFAFIMGSGFYVLRRLSGTIVIPMVIHGLWDFSTFSHGASGAEIPAMRTTLQMTSYVVAIVCTAILLWTMRGRRDVEAARASM